MQIDDEVVACSAKTSKQSKQAESSIKSASQGAESAAIENHGMRQGRMMCHQFGVLGREEPIDAGMGITSTQLFQVPGMVWITSPSAEGLISRMRENSLVESDSPPPPRAIRPFNALSTSRGDF